VNQKENEQDEIDGTKRAGADSTDKVMHCRKQQLVICNEKDADETELVQTSGRH